MKVERYTAFDDLRAAPVHDALISFVDREKDASFFQAPDFMELIGPVPGFRPVLLVARDDEGKVVGSLLGVYQRDGSGLKSWLSRRLLVHGGPLGTTEAAEALLQALLMDAHGQAIHVEFRNSSDMSRFRPLFDRLGFSYVPHLNFMLEVKGEQEAFQALSSTRRREIRNSLAAGATYGEAKDQQEVDDFHGILAALYRDKVRKPLPVRALFRRLHDSPHGRVFVVRYQGRVIGGSAGPVLKGRSIHYWYACGDNTIKGVHASVLATWAPIEHAARHGIGLLDLMGAGKPGQGYGVHDFKARFGGKEVAFGRFEKVLNKPLFHLAVTGLKVYQGAKALMGPER